MALKCMSKGRAVYNSLKAYLNDNGVIEDSSELIKKAWEEKKMRWGALQQF